MTAGLVIFSRMDSRRLPGKALKPFAGRALLGHVLDRAFAAQAWGAVIVATSDRNTDDPIAKFAEAEGAQAFRGDADDVLGRALACAEAHGLSVVGRICGDSPFIDPALLDEFLRIHEDKRPDLTTNLQPRTFPAGMSFEVMGTETLRRLEGMTVDPEHREHVTGYIYAHPDQFRVHNVTSGLEHYEKTPLTVDSAEDLVQANWLAHRLREEGQLPTLDAVLALAREWRETSPVEHKGKVL
ncbi:MAG: cytidylyltransferase domain-containing protein [Rhodospirillales bacterium]